MTTTPTPPETTQVTPRTITTILDKTLEKIQGGWIKGAFYHHHTDGTSYCLVGAIQSACKETFNPNTETRQFNHAYTEIATLLSETLHTKHNYNGLMNWNDNSLTTHQDVIQLIETAIQNQP